MGKMIPEDRKRILDSLFEAFSIVAEGTYVYLCDMRYDFSRWSKTAVDSFGLPSEYMYGAGEIWEEHIHPEDRDTYHASIDAIFKGEDGGHDMQYRARRQSGEYDVCTCKGVVLLDAEGKPEYFGGAIRNHGMHGNVDALTGLRNQYGFFEDLHNHIVKNTEVNICMFGINGFTQVNEMYGYNFGNRVLQKFGRYLLEYVGNHGSVYRMDGTKYAVISRTQTTEEMIRNYDALREYYHKGIVVDGKLLILDLSAGLLHLDNFDVDDQTAYSCLNFAYGESKIRRQGEMVEFYNDLTDENRDRLEKLQVIRNSIVQAYQGFFLLYQPVVSAKSEKVIGAEALIRWRNEEYGMVPPDHFIPILERDPLFINLGKWILKTAMEDAKKILPDCPEFVINVNLSYAQLEKPDFVDMVLELLAETGFPADHLCLEITERCRLLDMALLKNIFVNLQARGIRFALDDFGTGRSNIDYFVNMPVKNIKFDYSFTQEFFNNEKIKHVLTGMVDILHKMDMGVVVEGIETEEQVKVMEKMGVEYIQGYYYSKPLPLNEFLEFLKKSWEESGNTPD